MTKINDTKDKEFSNENQEEWNQRSNRNVITRQLFI